MAQIKDVTRDTLLGFIDAIGEAEAKQLEAQVHAAVRIANGDPVIEVVRELLDKKAPADFLATGKLTMRTSMNLTTRKERKNDGGVNTGWGPVTIHAGFQNSMAQETVSNAEVEIELVRASSNVQGVEGMTERLRAIAAALTDEK